MGDNECFGAKGIKAINIGGCPPNPLNLVGTLVAFLRGDNIELDANNRPMMFYGSSVHDQCERREHFDNGEFAPSFDSEEARNGWCLYELGCKGPDTMNNCPKVKFTDHWPVGAGHPCIGCSEPGFWDKLSRSMKTRGSTHERSQKNTQSHFTGPVVIDPLTRIEGHLRIEVEVKDGRVSEARSVGTLYRGLETILVGRDPRDVQHFTQRTCGVCTYTHALASTRALEDAIKVEIPKNATYIRNLVLGMQYLHDHIVHFYHLHALDFVDVTSALQADPVKAAKICSSVSPRPASADGFKAVQAKLKAFVESGQLGPLPNAYFLGGHRLLPRSRSEPQH